MNIQINDEYRIISDSYNIILQKKTIIQKGDNAGMESYSNLGYYPTMRQALKSMINKDVKVKDLKGIKEIVARLDKLNSDIDKINFEQIKK